MRLKDEFLLREIAGSWVVVPIGERVVQMNSILSLNESGALLWEKLSAGAQPEDLVQCLTDTYEVTRGEAEIDVEKFVNILNEKGLLE